jgi:hypothetical protein
VPTPHATPLLASADPVASAAAGPGRIAELAARRVRIADPAARPVRIADPAAPPVRVADLAEGVRVTVPVLCRPGGPWQRLLPGVVLPRRDAPSRLDWQRAALLYAGPGSVLTGLDALAADGLGRPPGPADPVHVLVPHPRRRLGSPQALVERTHRMPAARPGPVPRAPVARAAADRCRHAGPAESRALIGELLRRGLCPITELETELRRARPPRR